MKQTLQKKSIVFLAFFLSCSFLTSSIYAQESNSLINSGELLKKGYKLHDDKKYKEAIEIYKQINRSDTNYSNALYELSLSCIADSQFEASYQYALLGLKLFPDNFPKFSLEAANALDDMGRYQEAIKLYDESLTKDPQSYITYFNKGISYIRLNDLVEANKNLEKCVLINPYYGSAHFFIGSIYMQQGNLVPAILAYKTYLLVAPSGKYMNSAIKNLSAIAKVSDEILDFVKTKKQSTEDNFDMLQQILLSKIALDKQYELKAKLEDIIVRQIQVVDEKLTYKSSDKGFAMQYYVPLYVKLFKEEQFEPLIFSLFSGAEIKVVDAWMKKNKKPLENFENAAASYLTEIRSTRILQETERKNATIKYYFENGKYLGKGAYVYQGNNLITKGYWEFYHTTNGLVKAKGNFNDAGEKEGEWAYYYDNGTIKEKTNFKNGKLEGIAEGWFVNGNKWYAASYKNGQVNGLLTKYYYNGYLLSTSNYIEDKQNGNHKEYSSTGTLKYDINFSNDEQDGILTYYYANGQKEDELNYKKGKAYGTYKSYYEDGKPKVQGEYVEDKKQGLWTTLYNNGIVKEKTTYKDNEITGEYTEHYEDGKVQIRGNYTKKRLDGKQENYNEDGKVYCDATYDKGKLREINFYDPKGGLVSNTSTKKGAADITFYSNEGIKTSSGYFNKDGNKDGDYTTFYASGNTDEKIKYKDGLKQGNYVEYYDNGQKSEEKNFKDDMEDGKITGYYVNGKKKYDGWKVDDYKQQTIVFYNLKGDVSSKEYFLNGELNGYTEYFFPNNIKDCDYKYHNGWLEEMEQYDTTGKVLSTCKFDKGKGTLLRKHFNGKKYVEANYDHYMLNGSYNYYFFDGTTYSNTFYKNGELDGDSKTYFYGGKISAEGKYVNGNKTGKWSFYFSNGKISEEEFYKNGKQDGVNKVYNRDGTLQVLSNFKDGNLEGDYTFYGENNQIALILNYKKGILKSYTYEDKNGGKVAPIILKGSNGKINSYYKNGTPSANLTYVNGEGEGDRKFFFSNGKPFIECKRVLGNDDGVKKTYYPNGNIYKEEKFEIGKRNGIAITYYPNGKIEKENNYYNDDLHGTSKYYDEQGKLTQTRQYYYDILLTAK